MITVIILGIDPYQLRDLSRDLTKPLANICEVSEDDINFYAPEGLLVHNGVEQNTWNVQIRVVAPRKVQVLQKEIAKTIAGFMSHIAIHTTIVFAYYLSDERETFINKEYPLFLDEKNSVVTEDITEDDNEDDVFTGNIFEKVDNDNKGKN
jgi:hypothetical protein